MIILVLLAVLKQSKNLNYFAHMYVKLDKALELTLAVFEPKPNAARTAPDGNFTWRNRRIGAVNRRQRPNIKLPPPRTKCRFRPTPPGMHP